MNRNSRIVSIATAVAVSAGLLLAAPGSFAQDKKDMAKDDMKEGGMMKGEKKDAMGKKDEKMMKDHKMMKDEKMK